GQGDRGENGQQGACAQRRGAGIVPHVETRHVLGPPRRHSLGPERPTRAHQGTALQRGEADEHSRPLSDEQGPAAASGRPQEVAGRYPGPVNPETLDHVALWVADRDVIADFLTRRAGMHVVDRTDAFTLVGSDARRGKLTLFAAEGPRERGALMHV